MWQDSKYNIFRTNNVLLDFALTPSDRYRYSIFDSNTFLLSNLHSHLRDICFVNVVISLFLLSY